MKRMLFIVLMLTTATATAAELTLEQALAAAAANHPDLQVVAAWTEAAQASAEQAGAWPNPSVFLRLEDAPRDGDTWNGANRIIGLSQTIPWSGRIGAEQRAAEALAERAELEQRIALAELRARVKIAFAGALATRELLRLAENWAVSSDQLLEIARARVNAGDAAVLDRRRAEMKSVEARVELTSARSAATAALDALAALTGTDVDAVDGALSSPTGSEDLETAATRLDESPRLLVAGREAAAADALVSAASRMRLPALELEAGLRSAPGRDGFDAGIGFALPLFDRGGARLSSARADRNAAEARALSTRRDLESELSGLVSDYRTAKSANALYADSLAPDADTILAAAQTAYDAGEVSMGDVLQVQNEWIDTQAGRIRAWRDLVELDARIRSRLGE